MNKAKKLIFSVFSLAAVFLMAAVFTQQTSPVYAMENYGRTVNQLPTFGRCPNPGGTQIAGYATGMHQIPGGSLLSGSDYVYRTGDNLFVQCFCPEKTGAGIQSNWMSESYVTPQQAQLLLNKGWMKIDNGADWGLPAGVYYVKNKAFSCQENQCGCQVNPCGCTSNTGSNICVKNNTQVSVSQNNTAIVTNDIRVENNTGGNKANNNTGSDNTIVTGNADSTVEVKTEVNKNIADIRLESPNVTAIISGNGADGNDRISSVREMRDALVSPR